MTQLRLLFTTLWMVVGAFAAVECPDRWGPVGRVGAFVFGTTCASLLTWIACLASAFLFFRFPTCKRGLCHGRRDYVWRKGSIYGWEGGFYMYKCRCGDFYIRERNRFLQVRPDGTAKPFKKFRRGDGWVDEDPA